LKEKESLEKNTLKILEDKISQLQKEIIDLVKNDPSNLRLKRVLILSEELDILIMNYIEKNKS